EILARAIHDGSPRKEGPFVALNCSAFSEHLIESELFGHRKGAYTDARDGKKGLVEVADGGTLFLDEIGDFPLSLQPKILRFIQHGTFLPVGATGEHRVDVRIISATNRDLRELIEDGRFRQDLFYRINTLELTIPPVRDRASDIPLLLERAASLRGYRLPHLSNGILRMIQGYPFPGNVREIEALAARISVYRSLGVNDAELEGLVREFSASGVIPTRDESAEARLNPLETAEIAVLRQTLTRTGGNLTHAAEVLGLSRQGLRDKLKRYGLYEGARLYR
ncbi:MAG: sigma 54-interacting transcriptional regulator, partial [Alkalispirochaeta sp.]